MNTTNSSWRTLEIGFEHEGSYPRGISKRGDGAPEFILPSSVVLTSFRPSIVPMLGFHDSVGIDEENYQDPKEYREDFYKGQTDSFIGARAPLYSQDHGYGSGRFHDQLSGYEDGGEREGRPPHRRLGKRLSGELFQRDRRAVAGGARRWDSRLLLPRASLQHRRDARGTRCSPAVLFRVVLPLSLA